MSMSWNTARLNVINHPGDSATWRSIRRSALEIINKAEEWHIHPRHGAKIRPSNWSNIVAEAKRVIRARNRGDLENLLRMAATLTSQELRLHLHQANIEEINVVIRDGSYILIATPDQFSRIERSTRARHVYVLD
jgi:hypothetical protein